MYILSFKTGHDTAACLLEDGVVIAAAEEERFVRVKHASGYFPEHAIRYCLSVRGLTLDDVDYIVFARAKNVATFFKVLGYFILHPPLRVIELRYALSLIKVQIAGVFAAVRGGAPYQQIFKRFNARKRTIYSFDHHECHAASAYFGSDFEEAGVLCMDGKGEATSISLWHGKGKNLRAVKRYGIFNSLGYLYGSLTEFLGFRMNNGEYKVMGLAPYGRANISFDDVLSVSARGVFINTRYSLYPFSLAFLARRFVGISQTYDESAPSKRNADIAATLQDRLEEAALWHVKELFSRMSVSLPHATRSLCLAGGVALNVKMNKKIWESDVVDRMWVQPAAGDMGNVLGAAWLLYRKKTGMRPKPLAHLYLGPEYTNAEIQTALDQANLSYTKSEDISRDVARALGQNSVIAWFQGRSEFGPRSLGSRSVLANPAREEMKEVINRKIKFREPFRPFCPSFLKGYGDELFEHYMSSPFMVMSFFAKVAWREKIPAVCHVDHTVRPQEVDPETNPRYARLIEYMHEQTGTPVVLNTSLNVKGEPIVNTPQEAVAFFKKTDVDYLAIGDYLVRKQG